MNIPCIQPKYFNMVTSYGIHNQILVFRLCAILDLKGLVGFPWEYRHVRVKLNILTFNTDLIAQKLILIFLMLCFHGEH